MCTNPQIIENKRYKVTKKNKGVIPEMDSPLEKYIMIDCGRCDECRKKRAREWQIRLQEEIKNNEEKGYFITLTFNNESLKELKKEYQNQKIKKNKNNIFKTKTKKLIERESEYEQNIAIFAVRRWLERWRKIHGKSLRHWLIIERGHKGTERIHLHGIVWTNLYEIEPTKDRRGKEEKSNDIISKTWKYGFVFTGNKCDTATASYITKYITKFDKETKTPENFRIMVTPGIGRNYLTEERIQNIKQTEKTEIPKYKGGTTGATRPLPHYYYNKALNEEERRERFLLMLKENKRLIGKKEFNFNKEDEIKTFARIKEKQREYDRSYDKPYRKEIEKTNWKVKTTEEKEYITKLGELRKLKTEKIKEGTEFNGRIVDWKERKKLKREKPIKKIKANKDWREVATKNREIYIRRNKKDLKLLEI